ncbi:extracellular solute-binding protein [Candidatus Kaiserbacteria bacterium]|nr:extracellular solute-binding protein [Candidatus Kaiserbacteria bacterium]
MKKNSVFQIVLLCTFGALAVAGVLIFSFYISKGTTSSIGSVTIWGTFDEISIQRAIGTQMDITTDLQNAHYVQKDAKTYMSDLIDALASGTGPDLFFLTQEEAYSETPRVSVLGADKVSQSQFESTWVDGALPFIGPGGAVGIPVLADPLVLYWNKDILAASGFSQPPQYWDQLYDFAVRVTRKDDAGTVQVAAIPFGTYGNVDHAKEIISTLILQANGSITQRDQNSRLVSGLMAKQSQNGQAAAVPSALRFYTEYADPSKEDYTWNRSFPSSQKAFTSGQVALYIGYASELSAIRQANPNLNFAVAAMPQIRGVATAVDGGIVYGLAIPKNSKNPVGAYVIQNLLATPAMSLALSNELGIPSARRDVLAQTAKGDALLLNKQVILMKSWTDPDPEKTDNIFRAMIEDTTSG